MIVFLPYIPEVEVVVAVAEAVAVPDAMAPDAAVDVEVPGVVVADAEVGAAAGAAGGVRTDTEAAAVVEASYQVDREGYCKGEVLAYSPCRDGRPEEAPCWAPCGEHRSLNQVAIQPKAVVCVHDGEDVQGTYHSGA